MIKNWLSKQWLMTYVQAVESAARNNQTRMLGKLLNMKPGIEALNELRLPVVFRAIEYGALDAAHLLMEHGADVNLPGSTGRTPLMTAPYHGDVPLYKALIKHGADINARDDLGYSVMHWAVSANRDDFGTLLVEAGANPNYKELDENSTMPKDTINKVREQVSLNHAGKVKRLKRRSTQPSKAA